MARSRLGTGATITFATGFFAEIKSITPPGPDRPAIDTSHMTTSTYRTFEAAQLIDWGELEVEIIFNAGIRPPISNAAETVTITFPGGETWAFSGFMMNASEAVPLDDLMTLTATIKVSGDVTVTDDSSSND